MKNAAAGYFCLFENSKNIQHDKSSELFRFAGPARAGCPALQEFCTGTPGVDTSVRPGELKKGAGGWLETDQKSYWCKSGRVPRK